MSTTTLELSVNKEDKIILKINTENKTEKFLFNNYRELKKMVFDENFENKYNIDKDYITRFKRNINDCFQTQNINLFGGPGTGKSVTATQTFATLKKNNLDIEYISEYAKDLTYQINSIEDNDNSKNALELLKNQTHVTQTQISRVDMIKWSNDVDISIQDSPFILGLAYVDKEDPHFDIEGFRDTTINRYLSYNNLNVYLKRPQTANYQESGRSQSKEEAAELDNIISTILKETKQTYIELEAYSAPIYLEELGKTMSELSNKEYMQIFSYNKDKNLKQLTYHQIIIRNTIERIEQEESLEEEYAKEFDCNINEAEKQLKFIYSKNKNIFISKKEKIKRFNEILNQINNAKINKKKEENKKGISNIKPM